MIRFTRITLFIVFTLIGYTLQAQETADSAQQPTRRQYFFRATTFQCQSVGTRALVLGEYDVRVTSDSVFASLPYFGRYFAGTQTASNIQFKSGQFDYKVEQKKKGKIFITITPKDIREVREMFLTIFADGTALMQINSPNRELITLQGYLAMK
jgi:hypothetical protein